MSIRNPQLRSAILRNRILAVLALFLMVLMFTIHNYYRASGDWRWFLVGEISIAIWLGFVVARFLNRPRGTK